jgi:3-hydroxyacyl-CoA dehydrogenase
MSTNIKISKVAVLGAGVMGAQIASHFANGKIAVILFDLKSTTNNKNEIVAKALNNLARLNPKPLASNQVLNYIEIANFDDDMQRLNECDLIVEAVAEKLEIKQSLYNKMSPHISDSAIITSNTSGLGITLLAQSLPEKHRSRFCGLHFFNPPRYMALAELIPHATTDKTLLNNLETFVVSSLGKSVVVAKDTPNFIGNRLGIFAMLSICHNAIKYNIPFEVVDQLTGKNLGRAKSATLRTADVVGLDTFAHVVATMKTYCHDSFASLYNVPEWMQQLIQKGSLGAKTKCGIFTKDKEGIKVLDLATGKYRLADKLANADIIQILKSKDWVVKFDALKAHKSPEAQFLWASFRDIFQYASILLGEITDSVRDMDLAMRWGFGWKEGIFEIWQQGGFEKIAKWIQQDIDANQTISTQPLPKWVFANKNGVYNNNQYFNIAQGNFITHQRLPVYSKQLFPELVVGEIVSTVRNVLYENAAVTLWTTGDDIGILSFKTKMCVISHDVLVGIQEALQQANQKCSAMVIWQDSDVFSVGANLQEFASIATTKDPQLALSEIINFGHQVIANEIYYSKIPIVAAVRGYALGGGCELMLHCSAVVAALESYIGLVEAGVGLLPGWGGTAQMAYRASISANPAKDFEKRYKNLALATVATSAIEAKELGFLRDDDVIVMNARELLFVAKEKAKFMAASGYNRLISAKIPVLGKQGIANINALLYNMLEGKQISEHDMLIAKSIATVMCGGELEQGSIVNQDWLLNLELKHFIKLAFTEKTMQRIQYMLANGKPLRN